MSEFAIPFMIVAFSLLLLMQVLNLAVRGIRDRNRDRFVNHVKQSGVSCPKCDQHFDTYDEFYWHYVNEPTPADRVHAVEVYEQAWRAVGDDLRRALGVKK